MNGSCRAGLALCIGTVLAAASLQLQDLAGHTIDPLQAADSKATVFIFTRTDCPISNRYAPEIRRLQEKFSSSGVAFYLVYVDPNESVEEIRKHVIEYRYRCAVARDPQHSFVKMSAVRVTPEAAVFLPKKLGGRMVYRGRIDDRYIDLGKSRASPTTRDLERVLQAIVEGNSVASRTTRAVGCFISDLK